MHKSYQKNNATTRLPTLTSYCQSCSGTLQSNSTIRLVKQLFSFTVFFPAQPKGLDERSDCSSFRSSLLFLTLLVVQSL